MRGGSTVDNMILTNKHSTERLIAFKFFKSAPRNKIENIRPSEVIEDHARTGTIARGCQRSVPHNR